MYKFLKVVSVSFILAILLMGCNQDQTRTPNESNTPPKQENNQQNNNQEENTPGNNDDGNQEQIDADSHEKKSILELYPIIEENPKDFIQSILPGFEVGMSQDQLANILGEPNQKLNGKYEWEDANWVYEDLNGYRTEIQLSNERVVNFQVKQNTGSSGLVPVVLNKAKIEPKSLLQNSELGFEEVLIGTTGQQVFERWGEPSMYYLTYDEMYGYSLALLYKGVTIQLLLETEKPYVHLMTTNKMGLMKTYRNIKVGSSVEELIEQYGEPSYDWKTSDSIIYATDNYWFAIKFIIENNHVANISIYEAS